MDSESVLGTLASGETVCDRFRSHLDSSLRELVKEALLGISSLDRDSLEEEVEFGRLIGTTNLVETVESDDIVYARRVNRKGYSRLVKSKVGSDCSTLYIKLIRAKKEKGYILVTAFIGTKTPPEPLPGSDSKKLKKFWSTHALSYNSVELDKSTITDKVPLEFSA